MRNNDAIARSASVMAASPGTRSAALRLPRRTTRTASPIGIAVAASNAEAVRAAEVVVIAVKPSVVPQVLEDIAGRIPKNALVISVAAAVTTKAIEAGLGADVPVIRAMPNTPCLLGEG